jgi:hypothetical protein
MGEAPRCDAGRGPGNRHRAQVESRAGFGVMRGELRGNTRRASAEGVESSGQCLPCCGRTHAELLAVRDTLGENVGQAAAKDPPPCRVMCAALPTCMCHPGRKHEARSRATAFFVRRSVARGASAQRRASGNRHRASGDRSDAAGQLQACCVRKPACFGSDGTTLRPRSCELRQTMRWGAGTPRRRARDHAPPCRTTGGEAWSNTWRPVDEHAMGCGAPAG